MCYFLSETFMLRGLLDALTGAVVFPAMVKTADAIVLDPADRKLRAAMGAAKIDDIGRATGAAVERETFAHDLDRHGIAGFQFVGNIHGLPEHSQIPPRQCSRSGVNEVCVMNLFGWAFRYCHDFGPRS